MKYFLIAGEASGDLHASKLIKALKKYDPKAQIGFSGGDFMQKEAGTAPVIHYRDMAFMGVWDVLKNLKKISGNFSLIKKRIEEFKPDAIVLVDYPGFNLRMAEWAKKKGYKVFYYISPKLWAWKEGRVKTIKKYVDKIFVILPFEVDFYKKHGIEAVYVGNPVKEAVENFNKEDWETFRKKNRLPDKPLISLLPGSRMTEIKLMLPVMEKLVSLFPGYQFVIAGAPSLSPDIYKQYSKKNIPVVFNKTYELLSHSHAAVVTSGTATLETALIGVPQVVGYRTYPLQYYLGKHLVKIRFFSLVNLILNKEAVPELLQKDFNVSKIQDALSKILKGEQREKMLRDYRELNQMIGNQVASETVALQILDFIQELEKNF